MTGVNQQFGLKAESTYGTGVVVDRFYEIISESLKNSTKRTMSAGLRKGQRLDRADRRLPYTEGVTGGFSMDVPTIGFGVLLNLITGGTATVGTVSDANYTQTHTLGSLLGKSFTCQVNRQFDDDTNQAFTYEGCKVLSAEFAVDVAGVLTLNVEILGEEEKTDTALATASYTSGFRVFSFANATATIAGSTVPVTGWKLRIQNPLEFRHFVRGSALTLEPLEQGKRIVTVEFTTRYDSLTQYNRYKSATAAGGVAALTMTCDGDIAHAGTTVPRIVFTTPVVDFSQVDGPNFDGQKEPRLSFVGEVLDPADGSTEPLTITYRTTDSAI